MSTPSNPRPEHPSTYVVQDRSHEEEFQRLQIQDQMLTTAMGGVLPEQENLTDLHGVLDVGCGTGGWLIEVAKTYPDAAPLIGVDVSGKMLNYAREQTRAAHVDDRVEFHVMDALRMLEFPTGYFDLINQRFATSWLRTWDWPGLLQEYQRVTRRGGIIRVTEFNVVVEGSSPALKRLGEFTLNALHQSGHLFAPENGGVTKELARLLQQQGLQNVQTRAHALKFRAGTPQWQSFFDDCRHGLWVVLPFLRKWIQVPDNYEELYQQMLREMQQPDFVGTLYVLTAWGTNRR